MRAAIREGSTLPCAVYVSDVERESEADAFSVRTGPLGGGRGSRGPEDSRTGTLAAGQRSAVANVYTGNYAYGGRGAAVNTQTGASVSGGRVTAGNAYTGNEVHAGHIEGTNASGQSGSAAWARGEDGGAARIGDDVYAGKDGNVYKKNDEGGWDQIEPKDGQWKGVQDQQRTGTLDQQQRARSEGAQRTGGYDSARTSGYGQGYRTGAGAGASPDRADRRFTGRSGVSQAPDAQVEKRMDDGFPSQVGKVYEHARAHGLALA